MQRLTWLFAGVVVIASAAMAAACSERFPASLASAGAGEDAGTIEPVVVPPEQRQNASSSPVVFDDLRGGVWTANGDVGTISYVDVDRRRTTTEVAIGPSGGPPADVRSIALSPDGAYVAAVDRAGGDVVLLDAETATLQKTIPVGSHPRACVWDSANPRWLYVAVEDAGTLDVIDRTLGTVADVIPVGRLPAGLAVSATRREVYVTHRIDADVTIVDLHDRAVLADVPLADEPFSAPNLPNGKPLGFESLTPTADGRRVWIPHELLAPTHPFVFNETIFPAISVLDPTADVEQQTDPNSPNIDGRKNLFDAINLLGPDGQPLVFSQLCAVAMHPNGLTAWALACGSEDLLTFDVNEGIAREALRNLPGDHPVGMTLDWWPGDEDAGTPPTSKRLFVLDDQSHTLTTLDIDGGNLIGHAQVYGDPIPTVAHDPVDPQVRAGLTLFFRANSSKSGPPGQAGQSGLGTTGNDWMSCSACHLDGFGSSNLRLFESLRPRDEQLDAQIGHVGLKDHFSTTPSTVMPPSTGQPPFDPHDVLVALLDQGGLAPDATGANRSGQVDPSNPPDAARTMAQELALVVARDLPAQPTWLREAAGGPGASDAGPTAPSDDASYCGSASCHPSEYAEWQASLHAYAAEDGMVHFGMSVEAQDQGPQYARLCAGCHDPVGMRTGDVSLASKTRTGITCIGCHDVTAETRAGGNADLVATRHDWSTDHRAWGLASLETLRQPEFCGGCHQQFVPGTGLVAISTLDEYHASTYVGTSRCIDCHARKDASGHADHHFAGGNVYMGQLIASLAAQPGGGGAPPPQPAQAAQLLAEQRMNLSSTVALAPTRVSGGVLVTVRNRGAGHAFPTGVTDIREPWLEVQAKDASGNVLARFGGPDATGLVPPTAARMGIDIASADGGVLLRHDLSQATRIPFDVRVPAGEAQALFVPVPRTLPAGTQSLEAVLYYRNVRTTYYRLATGEATGAAPDVELARVVVP